MSAIHRRHDLAAIGASALIQQQLARSAPGGDGEADAAPPPAQGPPGPPSHRPAPTGRACASLSPRLVGQALTTAAFEARGQARSRWASIREAHPVALALARQRCEERPPKVFGRGRGVPGSKASRRPPGTVEGAAIRHNPRRRRVDRHVQKMAQLVPEPIGGGGHGGHQIRAKCPSGSRAVRRPAADADREGPVIDLEIEKIRWGGDGGRGNAEGVKV